MENPYGKQLRMGKLTAQNFGVEVSILGNKRAKDFIEFRARILHRRSFHNIPDSVGNKQWSQGHRDVQAGDSGPCETTRPMNGSQQVHWSLTWWYHLRGRRVPKALGIIAIKCPYSMRDMHADEPCESVNNLSYMLSTREITKEIQYAHHI